MGILTKVVAFDFATCLFRVLSTTSLFHCFLYRLPFLFFVVLSFEEGLSLSQVSCFILKKASKIIYLLAIFSIFKPSITPLILAIALSTPAVSLFAPKASPFPPHFFFS
ncbi:hypothetical protein B0J14DRAFT_69346 [Halenospora varia]|nr:hypothetical protein B0J14DRAFT_69346 [Halenospora varia]